MPKRSDKPPEASHPHPEVDTARCTGCGRCVAACSQGLFTLEVSGYRKHAVLTAPSHCTLCLDCVAACPVRALSSPPAAEGTLPDAELPALKTKS